MRLLPKNVTAYRDRHGKERLRFRKTGLPTYHFKSEIGTPEFNEELCNCRSIGQIGIRIEQKKQTLPKGPVVYFLSIGGREIKIGHTSNLRKRLYEFRTASPNGVNLLAYATGGRNLEKIYHERFSHLKIRREWFLRSPEIDSEIENLANLKNANLANLTNNGLK